MPWAPGSSHDDAAKADMTASSAALMRARHRRQQVRRDTVIESRA